MLESKYLKDNIENIQKLLGISALRNFETKSLQKLLRLSRIREYEDGEVIIQEGGFRPVAVFSAFRQNSYFQGRHGNQYH